MRKLEKRNRLSCPNKNPERKALVCALLRVFYTIFKAKSESAKEAPAVAETVSDGVRITFDEPQRAVTAGQAAVLYDGEVVLGGGTIIKTENGGKTTW